MMQPRWTGSHATASAPNERSVGTQEMDKVWVARPVGEANGCEGAATTAIWIVAGGLCVCWRMGSRRA
eukprot:12892718-Alexandrium_andersonii.AAC.1